MHVMDQSYTLLQTNYIISADILNNIFNIFNNLYMFYMCFSDIL
jgi:hypothetical protein